MFACVFRASHSEELGPPSRVIEEMLFKSKEDLSISEVRTALKEAAKPYIKLMRLHDELIAIQRHIEKQTKGGVKK